MPHGLHRLSERRFDERILGSLRIFVDECNFHDDLLFKSYFHSRAAAGHGFAERIAV